MFTNFQFQRKKKAQVSNRFRKKKIGCGLANKEEKNDERSKGEEVKQLKRKLCGNRERLIRGRVVAKSRKRRLKSILVADPNSSSMADQDQKSYSPVRAQEGMF